MMLTLTPTAMPEFERLGEIVTTVLQGTTPRAAKRYLLSKGIRISHSTINNYRAGEVGDIPKFRTFAVGYADRVLAHYGDEIEAARGARTPEAAVEWLIALLLRPTKPALVYEPNAEYTTVRGKSGMERLPPEDRAELERTFADLVAGRLHRLGLD